MRKKKTNDYTELLMNVSFTDQDGVVYHLVHDIAEDDFKEAVEIIGWMYQYYNYERKNVRDECNVQDYGFQNIFEATEKLGYQVIRYPIGNEAFLGFALIKDSERIIFSNSSLILSREIFSVAHEIGHQKLHLSEQH